MVRIGDVWDSTTDVLGGRAGLLFPIAALAFALPSVIQSAVSVYGGTAPGVALAGALLSLLALIAQIWGQLAVIAVASSPATTRADAQAQATARLPAALLVVLVLVGAVLALFLPVFVVLIGTGYDFAAAATYRGAGAMPTVSPAAGLFLLLYFLALFVFALWASARLFLTNAVVVNERRGIGAIGRSVELTRGLTWKLIGVALLFGIVFVVALLAGQSVVGLAFRLLLGPENKATALFMAAIAGAALTAAFTVIVQVFAARLYAALTGEGARAAP